MFKNRKNLVYINFLKNLQNSHENIWDLETWFLLAKNNKVNEKIWKQTSGVFCNKRLLKILLNSQENSTGVSFY